MIDDLNDWAPLSNSVLLLSFLSTSIIHGLQKKTSTVDVEVRELLDHIQISVHGLPPRLWNSRLLRHFYTAAGL
jgi:hypothetical protein